MEIKILCGCGAKFKFDVEPVNGRSPGPVHCPACGQDRTEETNVLIGQQLAGSVAAAPAAPRISVSAAPAPTPAAAVPAAAQAAIPAIRIPAAAPAPAAASAAAVGPKMTVMPVPESTKSLSVKPPGEAAVHAAPAPSAAANAATPAPGSPKMAFMPAPAAGSGASLSVAGAAKPEVVQVVAGSAPPPPPPPTHVHPAAARMMPSAAPIPAEGKFGMGVTGAVIGCLLGAGIWYFLALNVLGGWRILAWIPGIIGGIAAVLLAKRPSQRLGVAAGVVAAVVTIATQFAVIAGLNDKYLTEASEESFTQTMAIAKKAANAKTDAQVLELMDEDPRYVGLSDDDAKGFRAALGRALEKAAKAARQKSAQDGTLDEDDKAEVAEYRKKRLPELIKFAKGEPSRTTFLEKEKERLKEEDYVTYEPRWFWIGVWVFSSIESAYVFGRGKKK